MKTVEEILAIIAKNIDDCHENIYELDKTPLGEMTDDTFWDYEFYKVSLVVYEALLVDILSKVSKD